MSIEAPQGPLPDPNRYDVLRKDPRCPKNKPGDVNEATAKAFLCVLHNCVLVPAPVLSPDTRVRLIELLTGEFYYKERDRYRTGTENGISLEDLDIVEGVTRKFVTLLRDNYTRGSNISVEKLRGKAIVLSIDLIRKSACNLPFANRLEYAGCIDAQQDGTLKDLILFKNAIVDVNYSQIRGYKEDIVDQLKKPPKYCFSFRR